MLLQCNSYAFTKAHINISEEAFSPSRRDGGGPPVVSCDVEMTDI